MKYYDSTTVSFSLPKNTNLTHKRACRIWLLVIPDCLTFSAFICRNKGLLSLPLLCFLLDSKYSSIVGWLMSLITLHIFSRWSDPTCAFNHHVLMPRLPSVLPTIILCSSILTDVLKFTKNINTEQEHLYETWTANYQHCQLSTWMFPSQEAFINLSVWIMNLFSLYPFHTLSKSLS